MKKVVVLGGGIGGVEAAISLRKKKLDVELISERDYLFVYPLAIWIPPASGRSRRRASVSRDIAEAHGFALTLDDVTDISGAEKSFTLKQGGKRQDFDYLVVAVGAHKMPHKGKENVLSICGAPHEQRAREGAPGRARRQGQRHDRRRLRRQPQGPERSAWRSGLRVPVQRPQHAEEAEGPQALHARLLRAHAQPGHPHGREGGRA